MDDLQAVPFFACFSQEALSRLDAQLRRRTFEAGTLIIDVDSDNRDVFFVLSGRVRVVLYAMSGREVTLDDMGPGSFFGELAAIDGGPRSATVMALEDTKVASLAPGPFMDLVSANPEASRTIMQRLAAIVRQSTGRIMDLSTMGAHNRVHGEILRLARNGNGEDVEGPVVLQPIPTHSDIASRVSTTRETVARVFSDLGRQGIVVREGSRLVIQDMERLSGMVEQFRGE